jgi:penicillin-binding protein A
MKQFFRIKPLTKVTSSSLAIIAGFALAGTSTLGSRTSLSYTIFSQNPFSPNAAEAQSPKNLSPRDKLNYTDSKVALAMTSSGEARSSLRRGGGLSEIDGRLGLALDDLMAVKSLPPSLRFDGQSPPELLNISIPQPGPNGSFLVGSKSGDVGVLSLDAGIQQKLYSLMKNAPANHLAVVVMEPKSGRILALSGKSYTLQEPLLHNGYPAASLFKVITSAAALEQNAVGATTPIHFRGGNYTLNRSNYLPDRKRDNRTMPLNEALGKSCNPVFSHVALSHLSPSLLRRYVNYFGFNRPLEFDSYLARSPARIPDSDYEFGRTAAGFGDVKISPLHAASLMAAVANKGLLPRPSLVDYVVDKRGGKLYEQEPEFLGRAILKETADTLLKMMESTTTTGTSRSSFMIGSKRRMQARVAGKTGTLTGANPKGLTRWFIGAAPIEKPSVVIAAVAVDARARSAYPATIGQQILQYALER